MSRDIPIALIDPDPLQPRRYFDPAALAELAQSLQANGLAVPVLVRPVGERYMLVHGERRWRAARQLGWPTISADVRTLTTEEARWLALAENIQRADLTPIEEAHAFRTQLQADLTQQALGERLGKSQSYVAQKLRLLTLPAPLQILLARRALSEGHARQLLRLRDWYCGIALDLTHAAPGMVPDDADWLQDDTIVLFVATRATNPRAWPLGIIVPTTEPTRQTLVEAARALFAAIQSTPTARPLWELAAFWWGAWVAANSVSVANLAQALNRWHEHWLATVLWRVNALDCAGPKPPDDLEEHRIWWGFAEDARHMRMPPADALPAELRNEAAEYIWTMGSYPLPHRLQFEAREAAS